MSSFSPKTIFRYIYNINEGHKFRKGGIFNCKTDEGCPTLLKSKIGVPWLSDTSKIGNRVLWTYCAPLGAK